MIARYEIFEKSGARQIAWLESTTSLGHARCRLKQLTIACSGICFFAFDVENERFVVRSYGNSEDGNRGIAGALKTDARGNLSVETTGTEKFHKEGPKARKKYAAPGFQYLRVPSEPAVCPKT